MRQETIVKTYYKFNELSENAQEVAVSDLYNINTEFEWWDCTYEDAARIGLKITAFDLDRGSYVKGSLTMSTEDCAQAILKEHGDTCDTYTLAQQFLDDLRKIRAEGYVKEGNDFDENYADSIEELKLEFERALKEEYRSILQKEYEYLTSEEAIKETIEANDYEFDEHGNLA